jgi:hypothetical protein
MPRAINEAKNYITGHTVAVPIQWMPEELRAAIAEWRFGRETMGITIGSQPITTNRDEMGIWLGMMDDITRRPGATSAIEYRPRDGSNVTLTPAQVTRVVDCFKWYVAACFATERALNEAITAEQLDLSTIAIMAQNPATWPQRQFDWEPPV